MTQTTPIEPRMNTDETRMGNLVHEELTREIIGAAFEVHKTLGYGFLERVYQKALQTELISRGLRVEIEHPVKVAYKGFIVGDYFADLLVAESVVVELKIAPNYCREDEPQLLNELKEPLIKSHMAALGLFRDGMQDVRGSEWSIPFATSTTPQAARKTRAHAGCDKTQRSGVSRNGQIARSRCRAPRHRSLGYDLRRAPCDHRDFVGNAAHGGLNQRFLKATGIKVGLLINFGRTRVEFKRLVF